MDKVAKEVTRQGVAKGRCAELGMRSGRLGHAWATCSGAGRVQRGAGARWKGGEGLDKPPGGKGVTARSLTCTSHFPGV